MFALIIGAMCSVAFGAEGACEGDNCHVVPYFKGHGGFVGQVAEGVEKVEFVLTCGSVTVTGGADPDKNGIVGQRMYSGNSLDCPTGGSVEITGLMDGGWYWITGDRGSAAASLVRKDVLGNAMVKPTDPMSDVIKLESMKDGATTIVTDMDSGRMGILHHILPEPMMEVTKPDVCGPVWNARTRSYDQDDSGCMLGDGGTVVHLEGPTTTGTTASITDGMVYRKTLGSVEVFYGLYGNESGHIANPAETGWDIQGGKPFAATFQVTVAGDPTTSLGEAGVEFSPETMMTPDVAVVPATDEDGAVDVAKLGAGNYAGDSDADGKFDCVVKTTFDDNDAIAHYWFMAKPGEGNPLGQMYVSVPADAGTSLTDAQGGTTLAAAIASRDLTSAEASAWVMDWNENNAEGAVDIAVMASLNEAQNGAVQVPQVVCKTMKGDPQPVAGKIVINPSRSLCSSTLSRSVKLDVVASGAKAMNTTNPAIAQASAANGNVNATTSLTVMCPPASAAANLGQELVPESPWGSTWQ